MEGGRGQSWLGPMSCRKETDVIYHCKGELLKGFAAGCERDPGSGWLLWVAAGQGRSIIVSRPLQYPGRGRMVALTNQVAMQMEVTGWSQGRSSRSQRWIGNGSWVEFERKRGQGSRPGLWLGHQIERNHILNPWRDLSVWQDGCRVLGDPMHRVRNVSRIESY